ncbi:MAG TPA: nitrate reductase subunit alpha [Gammaproteobacteria bacterium]|nr:nitrate reductase subunit alpha [Gammaproteobacteria bacterium]
MSHFLDRLSFFRKDIETFSDGHGVVTRESRSWEKGYRDRWNHDKVVRSTHGVNCTGSCSWKVYVKSGLVTWETQQTDYPRTRPDLPNHEPRGCPRGASYSWYIYSAARLKHPLVRGRLIELWREARRERDPVDAWAWIVEDAGRARSYKSIRGRGGFVRVAWDEIAELIAASNVYTIERYGPDRIAGFSPIPAMSQVSFSSGTRYLSLIGGVIPSFYDWYCDLPPSSPQVWGEQTDVPESADWYDAAYLLVWGSNIPQTRTPDAHFYSEVRYKGTKVVAVSPDFGEYVKFADLWMAPKAGTDAALAQAMGHVVMKEYHLGARTEYFDDYCRRYTDMPVLVRLERRGDHWVMGRTLRASDLDGALDQDNNPEWKTVAIDEETGHLVVPQGSIGFRWGEHGRWNLEPRDASSGRDVRLRMTLADACDEHAPVAFSEFPDQGGPVQHLRRVPVRHLSLADGETAVATTFDLLAAHYAIDRGFGDDACAADYDSEVPGTPAWAEAVTGVPREDIVRTAREFADTAAKTRGRCMAIVGSGINHWYHTDMTYRAIINLLMMCGTVGKPGGGWAHYVGQEKLRPQAGWATLAFALDWNRPPRHMNGTSLFYIHTDQWRYEQLRADDLLAPGESGEGEHFIDLNLKAMRMGWLPTAPQLNVNPLGVADAADAAGVEPAEHVARGLKDGSLSLACEDPDARGNHPHVMFVWRSNLLGASGKGHEYFLKHLLGAQNAVFGEDLKAQGADLPREVKWRDTAPEGKLDLAVTLDFRISSNALYSDVVLPAATWYERDDLNTTDMHPFIHPFNAAVDPLWESRTDWDIFRTLAAAFSRLAAERLGTRRDVVLTPLLHDTPGELGQALDALDWKRGECEPVPGRTAPAVTVVERDYAAVHDRYCSLGPLVEDIGVGAKGIAWDAREDAAALAALNGRVPDGPCRGRPRIDTARRAAQAILTLSPETHGEVAMKAWHALERTTGRSHAHLAQPRAAEHIHFEDLAAQPRKVISTPTWSGIESEEVSYNASWTNVHELIPWRTLTGRQQFYQDHPWMRRYGEHFALYRPPVDTRSTPALQSHFRAGASLRLRWITPHQKWGIHSTYSDTEIMLTLSRGGPIVWLSEREALDAGIRDNDWIEVANSHGVLVARAILSQRIPAGVALMYHAQDRVMNNPTARLSGQRSGLHNSVTRVVMKPTHMIGGYAQLSYGLNYYGTIGSNRDEMVLVRRLEDVEWEGDGTGERPIPEGAQS